MADGLHWPPVMPAWCYRDPAETGEVSIAPPVSRGTLTAPKPVRQPRDRHYTQARRLHIRSLMKRGR